MDIFYAIRNNNLSEVKRILDRDPASVFLKNSKGTRVVFVAAQSGHLEVLKYIVENSIENLSVLDERKRSALHYGVESNDCEVVRYLIDIVRLDPLAGDEDLKTPYELAYELGNADIIKYMKNVVGMPIENMYKNPVLAGFFPDPSIVRVKDDYYLVNSTFTYFPCVTISHSKDLIHWDIIGHAIIDKELAKLEGIESGLGFWAPDISYYKGKFYIVVTHVSRFEGVLVFKQVVVSSNKAEGPYDEMNIIDENGIDPSIFNDDDGKRYILLNRGAKIFEVDQQASKKIGETRMLWYGDYKEVPEGPHLIKRENYYYLLISEGGTGIGHRLSVARSRNLMGPYESCPYNPILIQTDSRMTLQRAGHGKFVQTANGEWYIVYLCGRFIKEQYSLLGRETALDPVEWTADGWPIINKLKGPSALQKKPFFSEIIGKKFTDYVTDSEFNDKYHFFKNWLWIRKPKESGIEYLNNGGLRLYGSQYPVYEIAANSILVTRQRNHCLFFECQMTIVKLENEQEAGVICYYDENSYITFGVKLIYSQYVLQVVEGINKTEKLIYSINMEEKNLNSIKLKVAVDKLKREFFYDIDSRGYKEACTIKEAYYLCDEGLEGLRFTGSMIGVYAVSSNVENEAVVDYIYFKIYNKIYQN